MLSLDDILDLLIENLEQKHESEQNQIAHKQRVQFAIDDLLGQLYSSKLPEGSTTNSIVSNLLSGSDSQAQGTKALSRLRGDNTTITTDQYVDARDFPSNVIVFQRKCGSEYMQDIVNALTNSPHQVTIITADPNIKQAKNAVVRSSGSWIPSSICGCFKSLMFRLKSIWMILDIIAFPVVPNPDAIFIDIDPIALPIISWFTNYRTVYVHQIANLQHRDFFHSELRLSSDKLTRKSIRYANRILVQSECIKSIVKRSYPNISEQIEVLHPSYETKLENEDVYDIHQIIPDYTKDKYIFVSFGFYQKSSNFGLILHVLYCIRSFMREPIKSKIHFIIAAHCCKGVEDQKVYCRTLKEKIKARGYGDQVTLITKMQITRKLRKTLINICTAVVCPKVYDLDSKTILEAMYLKKPVVAVYCGVAQELLINNQTALLVDQPHPMRFAEAIYKLAADKSLCHSIGNTGFNSYVNAFSKSCFNKKLEDIVVNIEESANDSVAIPTIGRGRSTMDQTEVQEKQVVTESAMDELEDEPGILMLVNEENNEVLVGLEEVDTVEKESNGNGENLNKDISVVETEENVFANDIDRERYTQFNNVCYFDYSDQNSVNTTAIISNPITNEEEVDHHTAINEILLMEF